MYVDVLPEYRKLPDPDRYFSRSTATGTPRGHAAVAAELARELARELAEAPRVEGRLNRSGLPARESQGKTAAIR
jgi:hypothetical protein